MIIYRDHEFKNEIIFPNYYLFLDDIRFPKDVNLGKYQLYNWIVVRSYKEFTECIMKYKLPLMLSLDHDLAFEHYPFLQKPTLTNELIIPYNEYNEKTGYHCAQWLIKYCNENNLKIPEYQVHSQNPVGKENIIQLIEKYNQRNKG